MANYDLAFPGAAIDAILTTAYDLQNAGYIFKGSATAYSGTPTQRTWLLAPAGFVGLGFTTAIPKGSIGICKYDGNSWSGNLINVVTIDSTVTAGSTNPITAGAVNSALDELATGIRDTLLSFTVVDNTNQIYQGDKITFDVRMDDGQGVEHLITSFEILAATASKAGLLSASDKAKLDAILTNIRSMVVVDTTAYADEGDEITETLKWTVGGTQEVISAFTILAATTSKAGLMSADDKTKLNTLFADGYKFAGIAVPSSTPMSTTAKIFYIATQAGTYTLFGDITLTDGINVLMYNGSAWSSVQIVGFDELPTAGSENLIKSGGVNKLFGESLGSNDEIEFSVSSYNIKEDGTFGTSSSYKHAAIPVEEGETYYIISTASTCRAAFTTTNVVESGGAVPFVPGTTVLPMPSVGSVYKFEIPANCTYLMFNAGSIYNNPKCYKYYNSLKEATAKFTDHTPTKESTNFVTSKGIYDKIAERSENGNISYSMLTDKYVQINDSWQPKILKTNNIAIGDTITESNFDETETGRHIILDMTKYNTVYSEFVSAKHRIFGSASYHIFVLLDDDYKVVYVSTKTNTSGDDPDDYATNTFANLGYFRYVVFNNFFEWQQNPDIQVVVRDKVTVKSVEQNFNDAEKNQISKNLGLISTEYVSTQAVYPGCTIDIETGDIVESTVSQFRVNEYAIVNNENYLASGRKSNSELRCSIAYYDSNFNFIGHDKDGGGSAENFEDYTLVVPQGAAFVRIVGRRGTGNTLPSLKKVVYFKDINFNEIGDDSNINKLKGKTIAIIGASIDTHGNSGPNKNAVEITISEEDVGVELSAYVTYQDVQGGLSLGGTTYTTADIGTEVTFTPIAEDVGKVIGKPRNYNSNTMKVWWQYIQDYYDCEIIPVCWSGSGHTRNRQIGTDGFHYYTSHSWHDATIRKCGIRTPGSMTRTAPDVIIVSRTLNDFTSTPHARITEGYFDEIDWEYPDSDIREDGNYGFLEGLSIMIKKLRATYPFTPIVLMDSSPSKRGNNEHFPMNNGYNNQPQMNKAIKDAADFFGCQFIPRSKCAITFENMYPTYVDDDPDYPTHPNERGHEVIGKFVLDYLKLMNFTV